MKNYLTPNEYIESCDSDSIQKAINSAASQGINKVIIPRRNERTGENEKIGFSAYYLYKGE